ncbi:MAG: TraB/GumN family protein [Ruminococcaceae bacterium]|nr:TraB/GumN family protein [Oscillospiraceae bacterium]
MRRAAALVLLISALALGGCTRVEEDQPVELTPPFWEVHDEQTGGTLYLLGSMHVGKKDTYYPDYVLDAYESSTVIAAEVDTEAEQSVILEGMQHLMCPVGTDAKAFFGEDYTRVTDFMKSKGLYTPALDGYIPYFWSSYLSTAVAEECRLYSNYGSETFFLESAHEDEKTIVEIESFDEQYLMMSEIPMSIQLLSIDLAIGEEHYAEQQESTKALYEAWSTFDEKALETLNTSLYDGVPPELNEDYAAFVDMMYIDRQQKMADAAVELLKSGDTSFMLVGAAHFYVEEDILTLLEAEGYTITEVRSDDAAQAA